MATFTVDPTTLGQLSGTLSGIHSGMQAMQGVAAGYDGLLGGSDLDGEVGHFCSHWGYGISQLADHMTKVVQRLDYAAAHYAESENHIQEAAAKGGV
jgi:hypothetical protein